MPQPNGEASPIHPDASAEVLITVEPAVSQKHRWPPLWTIPVLILAIISVSSAATAFKTTSDVPAVTLAAWRLQLTGTLLLPGAIIQYLQLSAELRQRTRESGLLMLLSGAALAAHFSFWVEGIENTSITHATAFVSVTPIIIAAGMWAFSLPISCGEIAGTCLGLVGGVILAGGGAQEGEVSIFGDLSCLVASVLVILYLFIGRQLRAWMPLFVYAHVVTASGGGFLTLAGLVGGDSAQAPGNAGIAGWLESPHMPTVIYLAVVPGILGHAGINMLLKYLHPLLLTLSLTVEPLVGTIIGWMCGMAQPPGLFTWIGGCILLASTVLVVVAGHKRQEAGRLQS